MSEAISTAKNRIKRVGVLTRDPRLVRKIELALFGDATVVAYGKGCGAELVLLDARDTYGASFDTELAAEIIKSGAQLIKICKRESIADSAALPYPFSFSELRAVISGVGSTAPARLHIPTDARLARLDGAEIKLTESEHRLLLAIAEGGGEFVSRDELAQRVFGKSAEGGILNVYVHYLREKLEGGGEKIILSSRKGGYKIDKKYLGEGE